MKFSDLKCCPFCGGAEFYTIEEFWGSPSKPQRFDGKAAIHDKIYDSTANTYKINAYCRLCKRYLGNLLKDTIGAYAANVKGRDDN